MRIKVERFLLKQGNRVGKAAIEFTDGPLKGFHLVGFTICYDESKGGLFVLFPAAVSNKKEGEKDRPPFFFLRPENPAQLDALSELILDEYDGPLFNAPKLKRAERVVAEAATVN